jgi:alpha-tubulin suppressor-like RCC1 family protein
MPLVTGAEGDVTKVFMTDVWLVDRYVGSTEWNWGRNYQGGLGDNTSTPRSSPVQTVAAGTNWKYVTSGMYHSIGIKTDASLWVWGYNNFGQLSTQNVVNYSSPVTTNPSGTVYYQASAGFYHSAVIKTDGTLWMWGYNADGELGTNDVTNRSSMIQTVSAGNAWKEVACGLYHTLALKLDGSLWTWGFNDQGQLGDNTVTKRSSPVQTVSNVLTWVDAGSGAFHSSSLKSDGSIWLWGDNTYGQLGDNTATKRSSPVQTVSAGTIWKQVACGYYHTAAVKLDGTLWTWGRNNSGQLGDNSSTNKSSPVQTTSAGSNWKNVACGAYHTLGIKTDGSLWMWGQNDFGQIGDNSVTPKSSPVQTVAAGTTWKQAFGGFTKSHAVKNG